MDRRFFLKNIPFFGYFIFKIQNAFGRSLANVIGWQNDNSGHSEFTIKSNGLSPQKIPILWYHDLAYLSAFQLAKALRYHTYFNEKKKKIVLYLPQNQLVITANNAFVIVDKEVYQMPALAIWHENEIFIPVKYFLPLLGRRTTLQVNYDENRQLIEFTQTDVNITGVIITEKENGTVIRFHTTKNFKEHEITSDMRYGWLHVDFYGGKADVVQIPKSDTAGLVSRIKVFQFAELASIAFYLKSKPVSTEIISKPADNEVLVVLRTKEDISEDELAELREEQPEEFSEDLKKQLEEERKKWLIDTVVIDPGHGGKDPGTVAPDKTYEKDIVLSRGSCLR
jgi:N-acetylmuramoyl-L-alanine amidase